MGPALVRDRGASVPIVAGLAAGEASHNLRAEARGLASAFWDLCGTYGELPQATTFSPNPPECLYLLGFQGGGAEGDRTPDLLHAIEAITVNRRRDLTLVVARCRRKNIDIS